MQVPTRLCRLAVWERGTRRYLQPAGVRGWLHQLLSSPVQEADDDGAASSTSASGAVGGVAAGGAAAGGASAGGASGGGASGRGAAGSSGGRVRDMSDVFTEAAAAYGDLAQAQLRRGLRASNVEMARRFEKLSKAF